jgi:Bacterial PH domain
VIPHDQAPEHEFEAEHGLPEPLPRGERLLWQGAPDWRVLARDAMHLRSLSIYFVVMLALRAANVLSNGGSAIDAGVAALWLLPLVIIALAVLALMAWLISRTSVYTLTDKRVVMRVGVVLSITFNLPYSQVESAGLRTHADGSGDLTLLLNNTDNIAYVHLWPHARPWHVRRTQPMLRALPDARLVASVLSAALADSAGMARPALPAVVIPERQPSAGQGQQPLAA